MDISALLNFFLSQNWMVTGVQLAIGVLLGIAIKKTLKYILAAGLILFLVSFIGLWSLPEGISGELKAMSGEILGKVIEAVILVLPYAVGVAAGFVIGIIIS